MKNYQVKKILKRLSKAFTFVELVIVISIVAILSVIWFSTYTWYLSNSRDVTRKTETSDIYSLLDSYKTK